MELDNSKECGNQLPDPLLSWAAGFPGETVLGEVTFHVTFFFYF